MRVKYRISCAKYRPLLNQCTKVLSTLATTEIRRFHLKDTTKQKILANHANQFVNITFLLFFRVSRSVLQTVLFSRSHTLHLVYLTHTHYRMEILTFVRLGTYQLFCVLEDILQFF